MRYPETVDQRRRDFLVQASALGVALATLAPEAAQPDSLETDRLRIVHTPAMCFAPQYFAEDLLRVEGFSDVQYLSLGPQRA